MGLRKLFRARQRAAPARQELPLNLQLLFPRPLWIGAGELVSVLRELHPSLAEAQVECRTGDLGQGLGVGQTARVQWERHTVLMGFIHSPAPAKALEWTVEPSHYDEALKAQVEAHGAHATLTYRGQETDPLEQYLALTTIAVGLTRLGAIVVTNASARASCPAQPLLPRPGEDLLEVLRTLPLTTLFVGFFQFEVKDTPGVWMRTCGAPLMDMPDLALHARSNDESRTVFYMFNDIFMAMRGAKVRFKEGDMVQLEELNWRFRKPRSKEGFLESPRMIVLEPDTSPDRLRLP
jgi:hypothetical protein